jgi:hypothetical protein
LLWHQANITRFAGGASSFRRSARTSRLLPKNIYS